MPGGAIGMRAMTSLLCRGSRGSRSAPSLAPGWPSPPREFSVDSGVSIPASWPCVLHRWIVDLALTTSKWVLEGIGADGKPARMEGQSAEVARRQPDGTWLFVIDNPYGLQ